jgi:hypothetical protein
MRVIGREPKPDLDAAARFAARMANATEFSSLAKMNQE